MKKVYRIAIVCFALFYVLFSPTILHAQCDDLSAMIFADPEGPYNLCPGEVITLTAIISGGTPPYNILWSGGSTATSIVIAPPFQGGIDLIITDANDCDGYAHIHIKAFPWTVEIVSNPAPICEGELYGIYTWPDFPAGSTFLWSTGETTNNIFVPVAGTYSVTATSPSGACSASVTETISISTSPTPSPTISGPTDLCSGQSVTLSVPNDPNDTYLWNTGAETAAITASISGTYSVTVTNIYGCSGSASVEVLPGVPPLDLIGPTQLCTGESGVIFVNNFSEYNTFTWSTGATTSSINVNAPGDYSVTATGTGGCTATGSVSIIGGSANFSVSGTTTQPTSGLSNGAINITVSPSGTYTYNWSNGATTQDLTNLNPGTYSVTVTGAGGCSVTADFTLDDPCDLSVTYTLSPSLPFCAGDQVTLTLVPAGGTAPYTYLWTNGSTNQSITFTAQGVITMDGSVMDANGCTATVPIHIKSSIWSVFIQGFPATCGQSNGIVDVTVAGNGSYDFIWSNGATTEDLINVPAGNYSVTVTGTDGCTATPSAVVGSNAVDLTVTGSITQPSGGLNNGAINVTVSPTGTYTYAWSNGATTEDLTGLGAGTYTVTVSSGGGCTETATFVLTGGPCTMTVAVTSSLLPPFILCPGETFTLTATPNGGTAPYDYQWSSGQTTQSITSLIQPWGTNFFVTVTDANDCMASGFIHLKYTEWDANIEIEPGVACLGETVYLAAQLNPNYIGSTFAWSTGETTDTITISANGVYSVTITNPNMPCTVSTSVSVSAFVPVPPPNPQIIGPATLCPGQTATLSVSGGPYTYYFWPPFGSDPTYVVNAPGSYAVFVQNAAGCNGTDMIEILPGSISPILNAPPPICPGQSTTLTVTNAGEFNTFQWSNGGTGSSITVNLPGLYLVTVTSPVGCTAFGSANVTAAGSNISISGNTTSVTSCTSPNGAINLSVSPTGIYTFLWSNGATSEDLQNLAAGIYDVTVTGAIGCPSTGSYTIATTTTNPIATPSVTSATCGQPNGAINLSVTPATGNTFLWSNGMTSEDLQNIASGAYTVTVTGANGCISTSTATVPNNNTTFSLAALTTANTSCASANGAINLSVSPAGVYTFLWSNGATVEDLQNLVPGNYMVTVTSVDGCVSTANYTIATTTSNPIATPSVTAATCGQPNGAINLSVTPATGNTFLWSNGMASEDLQNIASGAYIVTVTGANGCISTSTATVPNNNTTFSLAASTTANTSCASANGAINLSVSPTGVYTFLWSNGATSEDLQNLAAGDYLVTVTLGVSCITSDSYAVQDQSTAPIISPEISPALCGQNNGAINLSVTPDIGNTFLWSNSTTDEDLQNIGPGSYAVTCTGANGCVAIDTIDVPNNNTNFTLAATPSANTSCAIADGGIDVTITPAGVYQFLWSNGATSEDLQNLSAGNYSVTITDANGCSDAQMFSIGGPVLPQVAIGAPALVCEGDTVILSADPGFSTYLWSGGQTTESISISQAGTYAVTVVDANGCTGTASETVTLPTPPQVAISGLNFICSGSNAVFSVPNTFAQILWSTGATTAAINALQTGTYIVTVTDANGCTVSDSITLTVSPPFTPDITTAPTNCDGTASLDAGSGYAVYLWSNGSTGQQVTVNSAGNYTVTVSDANGCTGTASETVTLPTSPQVAITGLNFICSGSNAVFSVPNTFAQILWSTGATTAAINALQTGTYIVTVTDANGCTVSDSITLTVSPPFTPDITTAPTNCDGTAKLDAGSGYAVYLWSNGSTGQQVTVNANGTYAVTVSDTNGCLGISAETVTIPAPPLVQIAGSANLCEGDETVLAAPGNYAQYLWSTGATTPEITITQGGVYSVTVSDVNGCVATDVFTVTQLQSDYTLIEAASCSVQDTGLVETLLSNQFGCDSLVVTNTVLSLPVLTQIQLNACPGESVVFNGVSIVAGGSRVFGYTAANGCDSIVRVTVIAFPAVNFTATTTETCWNAEDGNILVAMLSGVPPYQFALNGGPLQSESSFADLPGGEHAIEVVDANGCQFSRIVEVLQTTPMQVLVEDAMLSCETGTTTLRPVVVAGQPETLFWQWPDGSDKPWLLVTEPGMYEVLIDDGCEMIARSIEVAWEEIARKKDLFYVPNGFSPNDDGINDDFRVFFGQDFEVLSFEFRVFDRWGDAMFMTTKMDGAWDGVYRGIEMQPAVYAWFVKAKVQLCGGRVVDVFRKGDVTIVR